ncbi:MAG TPA: diadenylate cyclase CdaA [Fibrobacteraceae bacterium]|nr:diadenylate cyclase CdaA [Fibrobacteraceae bacterium]
MLESFRLFGVIPLRWADFLDVGLVTVFFYYTFQLFWGTRAVQMFFGFVLLLAGWFLAHWWQLHGVEWLFSNLATVGLVALVILFQPEMRGALTRIGQGVSNLDFRKVFFHKSQVEETIHEIVEAVQDLSKNNYGALIAIEGRVGLRNFVDTGQLIDAKVSSRLLRSLFFPNSALHDGAVIICGDRIRAAGCILPLPASSDQDPGFGMRHRAARALTAESDAVVVVVSEETAAISIAYRNTFRRKLSIRELEAEIRRHLEEIHFD